MVNLGGATENDRKKIVITKDSKAFFHNNVEHFCRQFRQHNGCTPGQYRKNASAGSNKRLLTHNTLGGREFEKINRNIRK